MGFLPAIAATLLVPPKPGFSEILAAAQAIAGSELATWRKLQPKADLALKFVDDGITPALTHLVRGRLGFAKPLATLDARVLTIVFGLATQPSRGRVAMEAYVFFGSFPKGFHAAYLVATDAKPPRVLSRAVLDRYEMARARPKV